MISVVVVSLLRRFSMMVSSVLVSVSRTTPASRVVIFAVLRSKTGSGSEIVESTGSETVAFTG